MGLSRRQIRRLIMEELEEISLNESAGMSDAAVTDMKKYVSDSLRIVRAFQQGRKSAYKGMGLRLEGQISTIKRALLKMEKLLEK